ncbi:MAG: hypothetical protein QXO21_06390 [Candidatus Anstonellales archaeon]
MILGLIGLTFIMIGICYFYLPNIIISVCQFIKKYILNEKIVILNNKKIGLFFITIGMLLVFLFAKDKIFLKNEFYSAYKEYYSGNFEKAERICLNLLYKNPNDTDVMFLLGKIYFSSGKYLLAKATFLRINNTNPKQKDEIEKFLNLIETRLQKNES